MSTEAGPETSRRRRLKSSSALSSGSQDIPDSQPMPSQPPLQQPPVSSRRRLQQSFENPPSIEEEPETTRLATFRGTKLRDAIITRSKVSVEEKITKGLPLKLDEQAKFFSDNWDGLPREKLWPNEKDEPSYEEVVDRKEEDESSPLLLSELRFRKDVLVRNCGIDIKSRKEQIEAEEEVLMFIPTGDIENILPKEDEIRLLEEEGFFVGVRPLMAQRNVDRMRERLAKQTVPVENVKEWFDESGKPLALPDPLRQKDMRVLPAFSANRIEKLTVYRKAAVEGSNVLLDKEYDLFRMEIAIGRLQFSHHYLFSGEHVAARKLHEHYAGFVDWQSRDLISYWRQQLQAVKLAAAAISNELANKLNTDDRQKPSEEIVRLRNRQHAYLAQIVFIRKQLNAELAAEQSFTKSIINAWRGLKEHRKTAGYAITGWKLVINRKMLSNEETQQEIRQFQSNINDEVEELYQYELREFESKHAASNQAEQSPSEQSAQRPDRDAIRNTVVQKANETRKQPGAPRLNFELQQSGISITPLEQLPKAELNRRHDVTRTNVWLRILVGNSLLSETSRRPLGSEFTVEFDHSFPVLLADLPTSIAVEIHESSISDIATVYIPIPDTTCLSNRPFLGQLEFTCPTERPPSNSTTAIGSGLPYGQPLISGILKTGAAWSPDALPPPNVARAINMMMIRSAGSVVDAARIRDSISRGAIDPNHPNNAELVYLLRSTAASTGSASMPKSYFRLEHLQQEFAFVSDEEFNSSARFKILELRDKEIGEFRKMKMIPANEREIDLGLLRRWQSRNVQGSILSGAKAGGDQREKDETAAEIDAAAHTLGAMHEFEAQRLKGARDLQTVREAVIQQLNIAAHKLNLVDVVFEDEVPSIRTGLEALARVFQPRRPLQPKRIPRKKIPGQNLQPGDVKLIVSVLRAQIRMTQGSALGTPDTLRIYAEVSFQEQTQETSVAIGLEPTWNEKMTFSFRAPNDDFSPSSLQSANDYIYISIFARRNRVLGTETGGDSSVVVQRFERRWLGTLKLRWSAVYLNTTIEGTFYVPQIEPSLVGTNQLLVSVYATLTPALLLPEGPPANMPTSEEDSLVQRAEAFSMKYSQKFPLREVLLMVIDVTGKKVFVCRYLKLLPPPRDLIVNDPTQTDRRVARFVSLIPFVSDMAVFPVQIDVWATTEQFLRMLSGDDEEHSCLLASYFLYLERNAFLAIGNAIPEGRSTYVVSESADHRFEVWDPKTGLPFDLLDPFCPLQTIDCVITRDNVFANVQSSNRTADCKVTADDLLDNKLWEPFFGLDEFTRESAPTTARSEERVDEFTGKEAALRLRLIIRDAIHRELNKWREPGRNALNRLLSHRVQEHLQRLEVHRRDGTPLQADDLGDLGEELDKYGVAGFTLQQAFTSVAAIIDAVRATRVWQVPEPEATFVLAVHVEPYPMTILAVWVYIGVQKSLPTSYHGR